MQIKIFDKTIKLFGCSKKFLYCSCLSYCVSNGYHNQAHIRIQMVHFSCKIWHGLWGKYELFVIYQNLQKFEQWTYSFKTVSHFANSRCGWSVELNSCLSHLNSSQKFDHPTNGLVPFKHATKCKCQQCPSSKNVDQASRDICK